MTLLSNKKNSLNEAIYSTNFFMPINIVKFEKDINVYSKMEVSNMKIFHFKTFIFNIFAVYLYDIQKHEKRYLNF